MGKINNSFPLVSIAIITYNSAEYVLDTLESAKNQTYLNTELIISDDCSTDNTVELCKAWLSNNKDSFIRTKIIIVENNTGIAANCNRGILNSDSNWIKLIAGDDILLPDCIKNNMNYVLNNRNVKVLLSQVQLFSGEYSYLEKYKKLPSRLPMNLMNPYFSARDQYERLLISDRITYTPSVFFEKETILSIDAYDEEFKYIEDYPMWLKLTKTGIKLHFMETETVAYRQHIDSLNNKIEKGLFNQQYLRTEQMREKYVYPNLPGDIVGKMKYKYIISKYFNHLGIKKNNKLLNILYKLFSVYLNPFQYIYSFKKHILKLKNSNIFYAN